jgi:hypothetical protein
MKITKGILGCALAAGLTTFAADKAQAGVVFENGLYSTAKIKLTVLYKESNGKFKKASINSKVILNDIEGNTPNLSLVVGTVDSENDGDIWVYNTKLKTLGEDLTEASVLTLTDDELISNETLNKNETKETSTSAGTVTLNFYDDPQFDDEAVAKVASDFDRLASQEDSDNWFELTGVYNAKLTQSESEKSDTFSNHASAKAITLSGDGEFMPNSTTPKTDLVPVYGSASLSGSGKLEDDN